MIHSTRLLHAVPSARPGSKAMPRGGTVYPHFRARRGASPCDEHRVRHCLATSTAASTVCGIPLKDISYLWLTDLNDMTTQREIWIDWLRVTACFLVMATHSCEPFYLGGEGSLILTKADAIWMSILNVLPRACVALFVVASSYLQFPLHYSTGEFFRRRASRILIPFVIWSVVYALAWGEPVQNFKDLLLNFNYAAGHLWFVYMLIGLYLLMPLLSPWAEKVGKK